MNAHPPKSYLDGLREKRENAMRMPELTEEQRTDLKLAKKLQQDISTLESRLAGVGLLPRRPAGLREEHKQRIIAQLREKHDELKEVMRRLPFYKQ